MRHYSIAPVAVAVAIAFGQIAFGADLPVKAPVAAPANVPSWTGWYVGLNAGVSIDNSDYALSPSGCFLTGCAGALSINSIRSDSAHLDQASITGGLQAGYNWQVKNWLLGVETDINLNGLSETDLVNRPLAAPLVGNFIHSVSQKLNWFGTLRGRVGVLVTPAWLLYGTGGLAYGHVGSDTSVAFSSTTDVYTGSGSSTRAGWTAGGGAEWKFASQWSAKIEYLYIDLGTIDYTNICITAVCGAFTPPPAYATSITTREHVIRLGVNYQFN